MNSKEKRTELQNSKELNAKARNESDKSKAKKTTRSEKALDKNVIMASESTSSKGWLFPSVGIGLSNGHGWSHSIINNSANWNTAYSWGNHSSYNYWKASYHPTTIAGYGITDAGAGTLTGSGTDNQITVWNSSTGLEGTSGLTYDGTTLNVQGNVIISGDISATTIDLPANFWDDIPSATVSDIGGIQLDGTTTNYLRGDGTWQTIATGGGMVYPSVGIGVSTGSGWAASIVDNSATWNALVSFPGFGVTGSTACVGNDVRLSDTRTPVSHTIEGHTATVTIDQFLRGTGVNTFGWTSPGALTRTNDTNVTLTLGGTPSTALLKSVSLTLGWTGTLADSRITSASTWNAKQVGSANLTSISNLSYASTSFVKMTSVNTFTLDTTLYAQSNHTHAESTITFTDIVTNNSSISSHGYLPKLGGGTTNFLRADGTWASPPTATVPVDDILDWSTNKYTPYATKAAGKFDVGSVAPSNVNRLNYDGYLYVTSLYSTGVSYASNFALSSDIRLKKNIKSYTPELIDIEYKQYELISNEGSIRYGVIAQELQENYPELVIKKEDGSLNVSYIDLHNREIAYLKKKIKELENKLK